MEKIFDWKGNEIKAGMVIYFVQTKPGLLESMRHGILMPSTGKTVWENESGWQERKNEDRWELGQEWLVVESGGRLCIQYADGEMTVTIPFNQFGGDKEQVIVIKDISDTQTIK